jgi:hypothetical protein
VFPPTGIGKTSCLTSQNLLNLCLSYVFSCARSMARNIPSSLQPRLQFCRSNTVTGTHIRLQALCNSPCPSRSIGSWSKGVTETILDIACPIGLRQAFVIDHLLDFLAAASNRNKTRSWVSLYEFNDAIWLEHYFTSQIQPVIMPFSRLINGYLPGTSCSSQLCRKFPWPE